MRKARSLLLLAAAAGGAAYFFSPSRGRQRRQWLVAQLGRARDLLQPPVAGSPLTRALASSSHIDVAFVTDIKAPVGQVYSFFAVPENYLWLSDMVTEIANLGDGHFTKDMLIGGVKVHFEERFTEIEPGVLLETHSLRGSALQYLKSLWFEPAGAQRTKVHLAFAYQPPAGVVGHTAAAALGIDPQTILEELMMAAKRHLENKHARSKRIDKSGADQDCLEDFDEATFQPRAAETHGDDYDVDGPVERIMSPDEIDQVFTSDRERAGVDERDLLGDSMAAQTDELGQNFVEEIQTAVTESPAPEELEAADVDPPSLEPDADSALPRRKPR